MAFTEIEYIVDDGVATITLDRPDRLNAFTATMARELIEAFDASDSDDTVRAVIVTGRGRGFCAGADLGRGGSTFDATDESRIAEREWVGEIGGVKRDGGGTVSLRIAASRKPAIAAINGPAVGVGATMTLPMDVRLIAAGAGAKNEKGEVSPLDVKAGDRILFGKWSGTDVKVNGEDLLIMKESDILGIVG